jgi:hypothetical protein
MAEATLPLPAKVHATVARALDWVWPRGAAWAYADAIAHAPGDPELRFLRGNALALNFHPGSRWTGSLAGRRPCPDEGRSRGCRRAWRKAHPGTATSARRRRGEAA